MEDFQMKVKNKGQIMPEGMIWSLKEFSIT